jgi:RNA polymerase sigma-70 factor, ECF subfamily
MSPQENGEPRDLAAAVAGSRALLVRQARRMMRDEDGAEDAVQDAMVAALRRLDAFRGDAQLGTWLYRVGANAVLMGMRRERRAADRTVRAAAMLPLDSSWLHGSCQGGGPQSRLESAEQAQLLRWAVEQLPEHYRCVVVMCDLDDRPLAEVAESLGLTLGGVRTRRLRAHRMLRDALVGRAEDL